MARGFVEGVVIGDNDLCERFNRLIGFITCFMKLITSRPRIFSQMGIKRIGVNLLLFADEYSSRLT